MFNAYDTIRHYGRGHECGCECQECNFYCHPRPLKKEQKRLDETLVTIHTDKFIRPECIKIGCCPPEPVKKVEENKFLIVEAATPCLEPDFFYTLQLNRETPFESFPYDSFIDVIPCGFYRGEVALKYTETIFNECGCDGDGMERHEDMEHHDGMDGHDGECCKEGGIPADPAFPAQNFVGHGHPIYARKVWPIGYKPKGVLIPLTLDLLGNLAFAHNLSTGHCKVPGTGLPYANRFVLYLNNNDSFVQTRNWRRRSDYA